MSRKDDRRHTLRLVFQMPFFSDFDPKIALERYFDGIGFDDVEPEEFQADAEAAVNDKLRRIRKIDRAFVESEFLGTVSHQEEIDKYIDVCTQGWAVTRLSKTDLAIMRLCAYEMLYTNIPAGVSINEAVELAKYYSSDDSPAFINGVLGKMEETIRSSKNQADNTLD